MLISCPKCHSIYEIPDNLVGKKGQNFRCHACANVWHVMQEDALGYEKENDDTPYIEAIPVSEPPHRYYPANKKEYKIPADSKSGRHTQSSKEVLENEGNPEYISEEAKAKKELTLTSDKGTSFTISTLPEAEIKEENVPHLAEHNEDLHITKKDSLLPSKPFKGYRKTYLFLFLLAICFLAFLLRREIVAVYPKAELWYNKISLSGLNNPEYLRFENVNINEETAENKKILKITAQIRNQSRYSTFVPPVTVNNSKETYTSEKNFITAHQTTKVQIIVPAPKNNVATHLTLGFLKP